MGWVADEIIGNILEWFAGIVLGALNVVWDLLSATVFQSPDVPAMPQVQGFAGTTLGVVNVSYVLAFLWVAILVMARDTIQARNGPGELIPRLVIGLIGANFALPICSTIIQLANALTGALTGQDITAPQSMQYMRAVTSGSLLGQNGGSAAGFLLLVIGLMIAVLVIMLVIQWIVRLGLLVVAVSISPMALALHGTPQTEAAAKLWWRILLGALGTVVIQAVALHLTLSILVDPASNLPVLGIPGDPGLTMNMLIVLCMLWGVIKVPGLMRRWVTQGRPSTIGMIFRVVVVQQLTRGLSRIVPRGRPVPIAPAPRPARPGWPTRP